jgi:RNA polymerase sigma-70 factor (ECF subfamily)
MPPIPTWFAGREHVGRFLAGRLRTPAGMRMISTAANGQPAFAAYDNDHAHAIVVLTLATGGIARITMFHDPHLFALFGLPATRQGRPSR